jgi:hypothetical protein
LELETSGDREGCSACDAMKRGRKKGTGVLSGIDPQRESWTDIRNRIIYDSTEWPLVALGNFLRQASERLPDNFLSIEEAKYERAMQAYLTELKAIREKYGKKRKELSTARHRKQPKELWQASESMRHKQPLPLVLDAWRTLRTRFERAVMDGDAKWFCNQAKALNAKQSQEKIQFNAKVVQLLETAMGVTESLFRDSPDFTLTPAGKFTNAMANDIWDALRKEEKDGVLYVEGCKSESKEDVMEAIHDLARKLQFELRKQKRSK